MPHSALCARDLVRVQFPIPHPPPPIPNPFPGPCQKGDETRVGGVSENICSCVHMVIWRERMCLHGDLARAQVYVLTRWFHTCVDTSSNRAVSFRVERIIFCHKETSWLLHHSRRHVRKTLLQTLVGAQWHHLRINDKWSDSMTRP